MRKTLLLFLPLFSALASCGLLEKGTHYSGKDCMWPGCHGYEAPGWTYAGTVFSSTDRANAADGVDVTVADSTGEMRLTSNSAGNLYTSMGESAGGYTAGISEGQETLKMGIAPTSGVRNSCHVPGGEMTPLHLD